jgi:lipid-binding SYLF domain-containing protein
VCLPPPAGLFAARVLPDDTWHQIEFLPAAVPRLCPMAGCDSSDLFCLFARPHL